MSVLITVRQCKEFTELGSNEITLGATQSTKSRVLLSSYVLNLWLGPERVREMIVADIRMSHDLGIPTHAADLLVVLRQFLSDYPEARLNRRAHEDRNSRSCSSTDNVCEG